jgi:hypothetical protein
MVHVYETIGGVGKYWHIHAEKRCSHADLIHIHRSKALHDFYSLWSKMPSLTSEETKIATMSGPGHFEVQLPDRPDSRSWISRNRTAFGAALLTVAAVASFISFSNNNATTVCGSRSLYLRTGFDQTSV